MRKLTKPQFITLEGVEGSGKSTQVTHIMAFLEEKDLKAIATREPGGTEIADRIRSLLVEQNSEKLRPLTELLLYNAARIQHLDELVRPALERGEIIVCDRFADATVAYQHYGRDIPLGLVTEVNGLATQGLIPDLTFLLDCDPKIGIARSLARLKENESNETRFEEEALAFHQKVREGYLELASKNKDRFVVIEANRDADAVFQDIRDELEKRL